MTVEMLTVKDVARITTLSEYTIRAAVRAGELEAAKLRGRILVHPDALATWIDNGKIAALDTGPIVNARPAPRPKSTPPTGGYADMFRRKSRAA